MEQLAAVRAGDVVVADFPGVTRTKRRPAVVLSTETYHRHRPDLILGAVTTNLAAATTPTDWTLRDWVAAGLHRPSAFRAFIITVPRTHLVGLAGRLTSGDWDGVLECVEEAIERA